jgi:hypothetical protein
MYRFAKMAAFTFFGYAINGINRVLSRIFYDGEDLEFEQDPEDFEQAPRNNPRNR